MSKIKCLIPVLIAAALGVVGVSYVGGPVTWDEMTYMELSLNTVQYPNLLNRFFHVYVQKFFFWAAGGTPLQGAKVFWCFLIALTLLLIYANARLLSATGSRLTALLAVVFFCSQTLIFRYAGVTYADFTVMTLITLGTWIFLRHLRCTGRQRDLLLAALGLILFCALKSKETGIVLGLVLFGVARDDQRFRWRSWLRGLGPVVAGAFAGGALFCLLDRIFLGDAWYGIRPANLQILRGFNVGEWARTQWSWFDYFSVNPELLLPFLLYLLVLPRERSRPLTYPERLVWLVPVATIFFLTATMIAGRWCVIDRYIIPALPLVDVWAAQFFSFEDDVRILPNRSVSVGKETILTAVILLAFGLVYRYQPNLYALGKKFGWQESLFYTAVACPLGISALIGLTALRKPSGLLGAFLIFTAVGMVVVRPLTHNFTQLRNRVTYWESRTRFYPLLAFADKFHFRPGVKFFVSRNIYTQYGQLAIYPEQSPWFFNLLFKQHLTIKDVVYTDNLTLATRDKFSYILLTTQDWARLSAAPEAGPLKADYNMFGEQYNRWTLMQHKAWP